MNNVVECLISCSLSQYKLNSFTTELAIESALNEIYLIVNPFAKPVNVINLVWRTFLLRLIDAAVWLRWIPGWLSANTGKGEVFV